MNNDHFDIRCAVAMVRSRFNFLPNRVVRNITSTCLPDAERLQSALAPVTPKLTAADAINVVRSSDISFTNASGQLTTAQVGANEEVTPVELVTLVFPTSGRTDSLELHIAWEINVGATPVAWSTWMLLKGKSCERCLLLSLF